MKLYIQDGLELKLLLRGNSKEFYNLIDKNRTYLSKWFNWISEFDREELAQNYIEKMLSDYETMHIFTLGIFLKEELIGSLGITFLDLVKRSATIGYWISEQYSRRGFMKISLERLIKVLIEDYRLDTINAEIIEDNYASCSLVEKLNFELEERYTENEVNYRKYMLNKDYID